MRRRRTRRLAALAAAALVVSTLAACQDEEPVEPTPGSGVRLSFGVFGPEQVVAAYQEMVDAYNAEAEVVEVDLLSWPTRQDMNDDLAAGATVPDVFLTSRRDLGVVLDEERNVPLFELLEARDVSYGDSYAQKAIEAFSADDDLQCMPSTVSPMVVYYNTDLIDFELMRERELPAPSDELEGWTFEEFTAAAAFASRRGDNRGLSVSPDLASLAPFLLSGGGQLYDDSGDPDSLAFASSENVETLDTILGPLRDATITLSEEQLDEATPLEWFERGKLGMIEGFRDLTPRLREVEGLSFDVMPMPQVGGPATIGDLTGLCISPGDHVEEAADFLVHASSDDAVGPLAESGYVVPANVGVARSEVFLQPSEDPEHAGVFNASVDSLVALPLIEDGGELNAAVRPLLEEMLFAPGVIDVADLAAQVDEASRPVLDSTYTPSPSDSPTE
jgi:multiple sugar transport system substrate-binding protein